MYQMDPFVNGFPGKSASHGAFGWSSVHLLCGHGRTILVETGPPAYIPLLTAALERHGLTTDDVTVVEMDANGCVSAMIAGQIDACATWAPSTTIIKEEMGDKCVTGIT